MGAGLPLVEELLERGRVDELEFVGADESHQERLEAPAAALLLIAQVLDVVDRLADSTRALAARKGLGLANLQLGDRTVALEALLRADDLDGEQVATEAGIAAPAAAA